MTTDLNARLAALSPRQRDLLRSRLAAARQERPAEPGTAQRATAEQATAQQQRGDLGWSLFFFSAESDVPIRETYELVMESARFADTHEFEAVWLPERHFDSFGAPFPNPALLASAIGTATESVEVRAGSVVLPLHDPLYIAENWAVLDNLTGGRTGVSLASGWHINDFVTAPENYERRREILAEGVATLRTLWAGETIRRTNGSGQEIDVAAFPLPTRPIPLWLTVTSRPDTWQLAGRLGMNVLTALLEQTVDEVAERIALYRQARQEAGHTSLGRVTLMVHTHLADDRARAHDRIRGPLTRYLRQHMELFAKYARGKDLGFDVDSVSEADKAALAAMAFDRYVNTSGLFGSAESVLPMVTKLTEAGVDELGCLIDFGASKEVVLDGLTHLDRLRLLWAEREDAQCPPS
ncbi:MupA/Atu3671 family FMN-dependent luciferase-like monooxygenase [Actinosynnema sp. NPDC023658]|uniref:MupA/Atu3671 family FMN-dependent luciferase-like monooxygenase n=1 Tax=Actinosynnema sp. NPDC023658 TaxID=3155465 RepID=UPI0033C298D9